ncbi:MAG: zinc ribbon domain-containing protein [Myxococcota bacterium]
MSGTPSAPLLHVSIPSGATLEGVAQEAEAFGLVPSDDGGFDVIGPIGPGEHSIAFKYRMPSRPDGVDLDLRFPREVQTLNVLVADTGLALESSRLHRRRPFRNRTRNYLHREAYNVGMHETVDLRLAPLRGGHLPQEATLALTILGVAGAAWFMISPLRRSQREAARVDPTLARIREEREGVYADIADLDHDFETGKLEAADYEAMRGDLRGQAIELLREERAHAEPAEETAPETASAAPPRPEPDARATSAPIATGAFCPSCGGRVDVKWKFCSHCGESLTPAAADGAEG